MPEHLFSESIDNAIPTNKKDTNRKSGSGRGRKVSDTEKRMQISFENKNKSIEFSLLTETNANLSSSLREVKNTKRHLFSKFTKHCNGDRNVAKARMRLFRSKKNIVDSNQNSDSDSNSDMDYEDSQVTVLEELFDLDQDIKSMSSDLKTVREKKDKAGKALSDN